MRKISLLAIMSTVLMMSCSNQQTGNPSASETNSQPSTETGDPVKRGQYLVSVIGCNDCHSTKKMTAQGPAIDSSKYLAGHPAGTTLPPINADALKPGQWVNMAGDLTAFVGPWGVSYASNITPDSTTGIGAWSEAVFIKTIRTGKHLGNPSGRDILPPMPWMNFAQLTDVDLSAVYAYLRSVPAIKNKVPEPTPPNLVATIK